MAFLTLLFYSYAVIGIWLDYNHLYNPKEWVEFKRILASWDRKSNIETYVAVKAILMLFHMFWMILGLFSSQWFLFLPLILISMIPKGNNHFALRVDGFVSVAIQIFIIINKYHLGYTVSL